MGFSPSLKPRMACLVNLTLRAQRDLAQLFEDHNALNSEAASNWYCGLKEAILTLKGQPNRRLFTPESDTLRHLLCGKRPPVCPVIYRVLEKQRRVEVFHIRHGARKRFGTF